MFESSVDGRTMCGRSAGFNERFQTNIPAIMIDDMQRSSVFGGVCLCAKIFWLLEKVEFRERRDTDTSLFIQGRHYHTTNKRTNI